MSKDFAIGTLPRIIGTQAMISFYTASFILVVCYISIGSEKYIRYVIYLLAACFLEGAEVKKFQTGAHLKRRLTLST